MYCNGLGDLGRWRKKEREDVPEEERRHRIQKYHERKRGRIEMTDQQRPRKVEEFKTTMRCRYVCG